VSREGAREWLGRAAQCKEATDECKEALAEAERRVRESERKERERIEAWAKGEALMAECYNVRENFYCPRCTPGFDEPHGQAEARRLLDAAVEMNHPPALMEMYWMKMDGKWGAKRSTRDAKTWSKLAAGLGYFPAHKRVAIDIACGRGDAQKYVIAAEEFRNLETLASNGVELQMALLGLAMCYGMDETNHKVHDQAVELYRECEELRRETGEAVCAQCLEELSSLSSPMLCGKCRAVCYCGKTCQAAAWAEGHKRICSSLDGRPAEILPPELRRPLSPHSKDYLSLDRLGKSRPSSSTQACPSVSVQGPVLISRPQTARPRSAHAKETSRARPQTARARPQTARIGDRRRSLSPIKRTSLPPTLPRVAFPDQRPAGQG